MFFLSSKPPPFPNKHREGNQRLFPPPLKGTDAPSQPLPGRDGVDLPLQGIDVPVLLRHHHQHRRHGAAPAHLTTTANNNDDDDDINNKSSQGFLADNRESSPCGQKGLWLDKPAPIPCKSMNVDSRRSN